MPLWLFPPALQLHERSHRPMTVLSTRTKEVIKTALAMTIALSMDWGRPYWAGFAVAFIT